jgi:hypothetical protein
MVATNLDETYGCRRQSALLPERVKSFLRIAVAPSGAHGVT